MASLLPSLGRRKLPMLEMPKLGGGGASGGLGSIVYSATKPGPEYALCDGGFIPYPQKAGFPFIASVGNSGVSKVTTPPSPAALQCLAYGAGKYVGVWGGYLWYSPDGAAWTQCTTTGGTGQNYNLYTVNFVNGYFIAGGGNDVFTSTDGVTFTSRWQVPGGYPAPLWTSFEYIGGIYIALGTKNWELRADNPTTGWGIAGYSDQPISNCTALTHNGSGKYLHIRTGLNNDYQSYFRAVYRYSKPGSTFVNEYLGQFPAPDGQTVGNRNLAFGNGVYVAIANGKVWVSSNDGTSWTQTATLTPAPEAICFGDGQFVAVARNSISFSNDGVNWTTRAGIEDTYLTYVFFDADKYYRIGADANAAGTYRLLITDRLFKTPAVPNISDTAGRVLLPWMKVA